MKGCLRYIVIIVIAIGYLDALAVEEPHDTVCFYSSWEQMLYMESEVMVVDPELDIYTPFEVYVKTYDKELDKLIRKEFIAMSLNDSTWFLNSEYLKKHFKGDSKKMYGYVPVFFNEKVAYVVSEVEVFGPGTKVYGTDYSYSVKWDACYYIDFKKRTVKKVTDEYLSEMLEDYHDLQTRYESMKDYKKYRIIKDYFFKYIDRATEDLLRPGILELEKDEE